MKKALKDWHLAMKECPHQSPGYCPKIKKSCFTEKGNACWISHLPLKTVASPQEKRTKKEIQENIERLNKELDEVMIVTNKNLETEFEI